MAGNIKDKEALQRINFLYQVRVRSRRCIIWTQPLSVPLQIHMDAFPHIGGTLCPGPESGKRGASPVLLFHTEDYIQALGVKTVSVSTWRARGSGVSFVFMRFK